MSQNNFTHTIYAGLDVAKATLQLSLCGVSSEIHNTPAGHARILRLLGEAQVARPGSQVQVIMEATGGYEAAVVAALHAAGQPLSVIQPARARHFARAQATRAKTDPIDAQVLADFGQAVHPTPTPRPNAAQNRLHMLVGRRSQLIETSVAERNRAEHYTDPLLRKQSQQLLALVTRQLAQCDRAIADQLAADASMQARAARAQEVSGVGPTIAAVLQAHLPELGTLEDGQITALAGLAPYNRDTGTIRGVRFICGGRTAARCALYMAALSAIRHDRILKEFYQRLRAAGKAKMVALTAVMRKLVVLLNRLLKDPNFKLQTRPSQTAA